MGGIEVTSLSIHVLAEHFRGFSRETEKLDATFSTPFVTGGHVLIAAVLSPIPDPQPQNFSDTASRFVGHADHNLVTQAYLCFLKRRRLWSSGSSIGWGTQSSPTRRK